MALIRDLARLAPDVRDKAEQAVAVLKAQDIRFFINETLRLPATQKAYFAQGRESLDRVNVMRQTAGLWPLTEAENKKRVTNTLNSVHLTGRAIDICPADKAGNPLWNAPRPEWEKIAVVMKSLGFEWGGDWKNGWDQPHYQIL